MDDNDDVRGIAQTVIDRIDEAWETEGRVPPEVLTEHAIYTNMGGHCFRGRNSIVEGTTQVKQTYQAKVTRRELIDARKIADGVIVADLVSTAETPASGEMSGHQLYVIVWDDDAWRIAAYQNTRISGGAPS